MFSAAIKRKATQESIGGSARETMHQVFSERLQKRGLKRNSKEIIIILTIMIIFKNYL